MNTTNKEATLRTLAMLLSNLSGIHNGLKLRQGRDKLAVQVDIEMDRVMMLIEELEGIDYGNEEG